MPRGQTIGTKLDALDDLEREREDLVPIVPDEEVTR